jgi:hypothetical protein
MEKIEKYTKIHSQLCEIIGRKNANDLFEFVKEYDQNVYLTKILRTKYARKFEVAKEIDHLTYQIKDEYIEIMTKLFAKNDIFLEVL